MRYGLQVGWIYAQWVSAEMIQLFVLWNLTND